MKHSETTPEISISKKPAKPWFSNQKTPKEKESKRLYYHYENQNDVYTQQLEKQNLSNYTNTNDINIRERLAFLFLVF